MTDYFWSVHYEKVVDIDAYNKGLIDGMNGVPATQEYEENESYQLGYIDGKMTY